jgi:hypothetical protein
MPSGVPHLAIAHHRDNYLRRHRRAVLPHELVDGAVDDDHHRAVQYYHDDYDHDYDYAINDDHDDDHDDHNNDNHNDDDHDRPNDYYHAPKSHDHDQADADHG